MVDLIVHQLRRSNPELCPADAGNVDAVRQAHVPLHYKTDILALAWRKAGPQAVLSIGQGIRTVGYDPIWHAAVRAGSPALLFDKWRRFETFAHSQNRVRIDYDDEKHASFQRHTVNGGSPRDPENMLICGLIIALLEEIGCIGLRCEMRLDDGAPYCIREGRRFRIPDNADRLVTTAWTIDWRQFSTTAKPLGRELQTPHFDLPRSGNPSLRNSIETVVGILMADAARQWKIDGLAREAGLSKRTLQRRLGLAGLSFSRLVRQVRIHEACRLLKDSDAPVTSIGFCAGFSDSAHLSRDFRASMGMTPSDYRAVYRCRERRDGRIMGP